MPIHVISFDGSHDQINICVLYNGNHANYQFTCLIIN